MFFVSPSFSDIAATVSCEPHVQASPEPKRRKEKKDCEVLAANVAACPLAVLPGLSPPAPAAPLHVALRTSLWQTLRSPAPPSGPRPREQVAWPSRWPRAEPQLRLYLPRVQPSPAQPRFGGPQRVGLRGGGSQGEGGRPEWKAASAAHQARPCSRLPPVLADTAPARCHCSLAWRQLGCTPGVLQGTACGDDGVQPCQ